MAFKRLHPACSVRSALLRLLLRFLQFGKTSDVRSISDSLTHHIQTAAMETRPTSAPEAGRAVVRRRGRQARACQRWEGRLKLSHKPTWIKRWRTEGYACGPRRSGQRRRVGTRAWEQESGRGKPGDERGGNIGPGR